MRSLSVFVLAALAVCALAAVSVQAQAPIPYRPDGWQIGGPVTAPIQLDVFVDLLCPDCAAAWPTVKQLIQHYGANLAVALHTFPLPYHTNGFLAAQAAHVCVVNGAAPAAVADFVFGIQASYWNDVTANTTFTAVSNTLGNALQNGKLVTAQNYANGMASDDINNDVRVSWKYACSRGVLGTPTFFVNGVNINGDPSWTLADWQSILDPLLQPQPAEAAAAEVVAPVSVKSARKHHRHVSAATACMQRREKSGFADVVGDCPAGEATCTYLPGKVQCCFAGEMCIPNVGCRC